MTTVYDRVWVTRQGVAQGKYLSIETGKYRLNFSQTHAPAVGERIELFGAIEDRSQCESSSQIVLIVHDYGVIQKNTLSPFYIMRYPVASFEIITNRYLQSTEEEMYRFLPSEHVHILLGMTVGRKYSSQENIALAMKAAGLTHVLVASGANIALLIQFTRAVMRKLFSRSVVVFVSLITAGLYAMIVGNQAPILRAFFMFAFVSISSLVGRKTTWYYPLLFAGGILMIVQPLLIFSLSFWLTIAASAAILVDIGGEEPELVDTLARLQSDLTQTFRSTFLVFLFTMPILLYTIGQTTLASLCSGVLLLWLVAPITIIGLLTLLILWSVPTFLHGVFYLILWVPLELFVRFVNLISNINVLSFSLSHLTVLGCVLYYGVLGVWCFFEIATQHNER